MNKDRTWRGWLAPLASLRLTVALLGLAMVLVFVGTLAQTQSSIYAVQKQYFHSFAVYADLGLFHLPMPGGYAIGGLLLLNLLAAHAVRFQWAWKRSGIVLVHGGLILLLLGELATSLFAVEMRMSIDEGGSASYAYDIRECELAMVDATPSGHDMVTAFPPALLKPGQELADASLPFKLRVERFYSHSILASAREAGPAFQLADRGLSAQVVAIEQPFTRQSDGVDIPSAYVSVLSDQGQVAGTWLLSMHIDRPQEVEIKGRKYLLALRARRYYKPYTLHLMDFIHEKHPGTEIPRHFASHVRLVDPLRHEDRQVEIYMNHPLRYEGETFYQSGFDNNDRTTILEVVRNPGWVIPYLSCVLTGAGMLLQFGIHLRGFLRRQASAAQMLPAMDQRRQA